MVSSARAGTPVLQTSVLYSNPSPTPGITVPSTVVFSKANSGLFTSTLNVGRPFVVLICGLQSSPVVEHSSTGPFAFVLKSNCVIPHCRLGSIAKVISIITLSASSTPGGISQTISLKPCAPPPGLVEVIVGLLTLAIQSSELAGQEADKKSIFSLRVRTNWS